ncbi:NAC domain-containing protein 82 isoform X2 [Benincasa hispida]|nr:NAC domain-containing protein 82 isoform X2 [Benincasa hispida]
MNRATQFGYWKSTGKDRPVHYNNKEVGQIKTLTFFRGKAPKGDQTDWVMHEYRIEENNLSLDVAQDAYVLCVIFQKDGPGPRNGAQYGAPFKEEDWEEDSLEEVDSLEVDLSSGLSVLPSKEPLNSFAPDTSLTPSNVFGCSSASCISENMASTSKEMPQIASGNIAPLEIPGNCNSLDDLFTIEDFFPENGNLDAYGFQASVAASKYTDQTDTIFKDLEDLGGWSPLNGDGNACVTGHGVTCSSEPTFPFRNKGMFSSDQRPYLELNDLDSPLSSTYRDMQMSNAAYNGSSIIEQPCFPFSSFGAANQNILSCQYPSLHHSNDQICHPTDLGYPDAHMSASIQSAWLQEIFHPNSNVGCNGGNEIPWHHDTNLC